jgi:hypothetical protein
VLARRQLIALCEVEVTVSTLIPILAIRVGRLVMPGRLLDPSEHPKKEIRAVLVRLVSIEVSLGGGRPEATAGICCRLTTALFRSMLGECEEVDHGR